MDSIYGKVGIFLIGVFIAKVLPSGIEKVFIFVIGIILTLMTEIFCLFLYIKKKSRVYSPSTIFQESQIPETECTNRKSQSLQRSPRKSNVNKFALERRMTIIQCPCSDANFEILLSGNDRMFIELSNHIKELISTHKKYGLSLIKIGEIGLIEKLKTKKSMIALKNFREFLFDLGEKIVKETEDLSENLIQNINHIEKETKKKYKEMSEKLKNSGEKFYSVSTKIQDLTKKLNSVQNTQKKASSEYNEAKKDLAQFETLVKKEMKLKKISNDIGSLKAQMKKLSETMSEESKNYLPKAIAMMKELDQLDKSKAYQYKCCFQLWLSHLLNISLYCSERISKTEGALSEESKKSDKSSFKKTVNFFKGALKSEKVKDNLHIKSLFASFSGEDTSNSKKLEHKFVKIEGFGSDILKFFNLLFSAEEEYLNENLRILNNWHDLKNSYLLDKFADMRNKLVDYFSISKDYKLELFAAVNKFKDFVEDVKNYRKEITQFQMTGEELEVSKGRLCTYRERFTAEVLEIKPRLVELLKVSFERAIKEQRQNINYLNSPEEFVLDFNSFNQRAKVHRFECPYYVYELEHEENLSHKIEEPVKINDPESALWLNDLLNSFISEWRYSPRFNDYIRKKLKKIYNKDNPEYIGEIEVIDVEIGDKAPEIKDLTPLETENELEFFYEFDLWFRGDVKIHLEFPLKFSVAEMNVSVKVVLRSFYGKVRLFYTPSNIGCSWYSFISEPVNQISLEPVIGKMSKIALSKIPQVNSIIVSRLSRKIRKYVWPNRRSVKIFKGQKSSFALD